MTVTSVSPAPNTGRSAFRPLFREAQARRLQRNLLLAAAVYLAFVCWDLIVAPMDVRATLLIRVLFLALCVFVVVASRSARFRRWYSWYYILVYSAASFGVAAVLWIVPDGFVIGIPGILICIFAGSALARVPAWVAATAGTLTTLGVVLLMTLHGEPIHLIQSAAIFLVVAVGFTVLHSEQAESSAYEIHAAQERLESEKIRTEQLLVEVTVARQERLTWLEDLARFLRHELSNQIVAVSTSIDLAKSDGSPFGIQTYLQRAQRSLARMRGLVSSATEATSLEAALAVDEVERVDFSGVVVDRVSAFQQLHPAQLFDLRLRPSLSIDGNEERLVQLIDKLLCNAVERSTSHGEVAVHLRAAGDDWVELIVENEGDRLPEDKERIFDAFVSTQRHAGNLGLGLFVARSIAHNHGGAIVAEDRDEGSGARFVVRLPKRPVDRSDLAEDRVPDRGSPDRRDQSELGN